MAIITRYVNPASVGGDGTTSGLSGATAAYASLSAWNAAEANDLVTATNSHVVNCAGSTADTTAVTLSATWTTSATYDITINGDLASSKWDATKYRLSASLYPLTINISHVNINNFQSENSADDNSIGAINIAGAAIVTIDKCIFRIKPQAYTYGNNARVVMGNTDRTGNLKISNTLIYGADAVGVKSSTYGFFETNHSSGNTYLSNITVAECINGISDGYNDIIAINCLCYNNTTADFSASFNASSNYNASSDTSAPGANSRISQTFTFVDSANGDFGLTSSDAGARDYGTDLSAGTPPVSDDIIGTARPQNSTYDIGYFEYVTSGASITASDATATRGQTDYKFTLAGGDATPATATLSDGTNTAAITITTYNADGINTCIIPSTIPIQHIATATLTVTDAVSGTPTASVDFQPASGMTFTNITSIAGTDADFTFGYAGATVASGKQVVYETPTLEDSLAIVVSVDCSYTLGSPLTQNNTSDYYVIDADGTIGVTDTNTFLFSAGGSGTGNGGFISSFGKLGLR